jgi:YggT family protein
VVPAGIIVTVTDPPLKFLRRFIKPIQFGVISLDLAWTVLFIIVIILRDITRALIG